MRPKGPQRRKTDPSPDRCKSERNTWISGAKKTTGNPIKTHAAIGEATPHIRLAHDECWKSRGFKADKAYLAWGRG